MGDLLADRYLLGDEIGAGSGTRVFAALDQRLDRRVAVKLFDALDEEGLAAFRDRAATAAAIRHPHVVTMYDFGIEEGQAWVVMRQISGSDLDHRVGAGVMDAAEALRLANGLFSGLEATHGAGVVHRHLTSRDVLFDGNGLALLADHGLPRGVRDRTTDALEPQKRLFIAPERLRGADATTGSDIFAAGVVLRHAITGDYARDCPVGHVLAPVVQACTAVDTHDRPDSATEVLGMLAEVDAGDVDANPDPLEVAEQTEDMDNRRALLLFLLVAGILAAVLTAALGSGP